MQRLVDTVSRVTGPAADAVAVEIATAQERATRLAARQREIDDGLTDLKAQTINREEVALALEQFD